MSLFSARPGAASLLLLLCLTNAGLASADASERGSAPAGRQMDARGTAPGTHLIPTVTADTLAGNPVRLPADLRGKIGVLVLGFGKDSRLQVRDWGTRLIADFSNSTSILYYEMPVIAGVPRLLRGVVLRSIAAEVADLAKPHFLPISGNESRWRELAGYRDPDVAYVLVVDGSGQVQWSTSGALTDAAYTALRQHLSAPVK